MTDIPIIVVSSSCGNVGKTTFALNLAITLLCDKYEVIIFSPCDKLCLEFMQKRKELRREKNIKLLMPKIISDFSQINTLNKSEKQVIVADIPILQNNKYDYIFAQAHTLITLVASPQNINWSLNDKYLNLVWNSKKKLASLGRKYLNWIVVENQMEENGASVQHLIEEQSKKLGFRIAPKLNYRKSYQHISNGFAVADMANKNNNLPMILSDVYARQEILSLTDFMWQTK